MSSASNGGSIPQGRELVEVVLKRMGHGDYAAGVNGTCYECPFASPPLDSAGRIEAWQNIANDPTEAYFRCGLPGRDNEVVVWGEYAPCNEAEWSRAALEALNA